MYHSKSYELLLKDISIIKGVGPKNKKILKKKILKQYLIYFGICLKPLLIDQI